ncbi:MAG: tyrosine-type recombinase/integrase [Chloroflexota bacterium]
MNQASTLARRPAGALVASLGDAAGAKLPSYVTRDQARAIINAAETTRDRLLLEGCWQTGGRVSEVLRLRPCDVHRREGALVLTNLKQRRRALRQKLVYVSPELVRDLATYARDAGLSPMSYFFQSQKSDGQPMSRQHAWRLIQQHAQRAGVAVVGGDGQLRPATGLDFRHGAAVHQLRAGVPLTEVQQQLGHARIDTTTIYTKLTNPERRSYADRVEW